jgi:hypothetical protein
MMPSQWATRLLAVFAVGAAVWAHASCSASSGTDPGTANTAGGHGNGGTGSGGASVGGGGSGSNGGSSSGTCTGPKNKCGTCTPECKQGGAGSSPFPIDVKADPNVTDASGVTLDKNGDLILDASKGGFNYMWISNTYDISGSAACAQTNPGNAALCRGTLSKIDTVGMKEVARYYTVTCTTKTGATGCEDANGLPITLAHNHTPSRTAVDYNYDAWVANRSLHGGQPSASKVANNPADCIDRNKNGTIDTSADTNGDGTIDVDCNGDGQPDNLSTVCAGAMAGKSPEFLGDDDECILFTTNYADPNDLGRSMCLDVNRFKVGPSNAWVGTFGREANGKPYNNFYEIDGVTGKILSVVELPKGHNTYGCAVDDKHIVWATDIGEGTTRPGSLAFFSASEPHLVGPLMRGPTANNPWQDASGEYHHYGITVNGDQHVWLGGWTSSWVLRYKPNRANFNTLSQGTWTRIDVPEGFFTRGIAADTRGKVWVAVHQGYILRLDQNLPDGVHDLRNMTDYWKLGADTVIGAGIDMAGHIWGVGHGNKTASRLDVDDKGNVIMPATGETNNVKIGENPYTYSDFTGYALMKFLISQGRYGYQLNPCPNNGKANWMDVNWNATTPPQTEVILRVRSGDSAASFGPWSPEFKASPAQIGKTSSTPIAPNPSTYIEVEFTLRTQDKNVTPILHDYTVGFTCPTSAN